MRIYAYRIIAHSLEPITNAAKEVVEVSAVLVVVELTSSLSNTLGMRVAVGLEDIPRLEKNLAYVHVDSFEPLTERFVLLRVVSEVTEGIKHMLHRHAVGETLEEGAELLRAELQVRVLGNASSVVGTMASDSAPVAGVFFDETEEPTDGLLVVVVLLTLHNDLLATEDKLVTAFFGEILLREKVLAAIDVLVGGVLVFLRNTLVKTALDIVLVNIIVNICAYKGEKETYANITNLGHHALLLLVCGNLRVLRLGDLLSVPLTLSSGLVALGHSFGLRLIKLGLCDVAVLANRFGTAISTNDVSLVVMRVSPDGLVGSRDTSLKDGSLVGTSDTTASSDKLVGGCRLINVAKLLLGRSDNA